MTEPNIRSALAEHLNAYAEVVSSSSRQWASELARRVAMLIIGTFFALLTLVVGIFVAILASWDTPYRWWVAGGILLLCVAGIVAGLYAAQRALRTRAPPPWTILADQVATDLRGTQGTPAPIKDNAAATRLQSSREQLHGMFARPAGASSGAGGGAKLGLGIAGVLIMALLRRKTRSMGGVGLALSLGMAALKLIRRRKEI